MYYLHGLMNKSVVTHLVAVLLVAVGFFVDIPFKEPVLVAGLFALSGSLTNWLAIHMLFEKVPGIYGSGVITVRFEDFKQGIYHLVMAQLFSRETLDHFMADMVAGDADTLLDFEAVIEKIDLHPVFDDLVSVIMDSSFASMLNMFGGQKALLPLKQPFVSKMKQSLYDIAHSEAFQSHIRQQLSISSVSTDLYGQIERIVQSRLDEMTAVMVKDIIHAMIRQHLGWLVVWGGVFGGLIGLASQIFFGVI